jgi:probable selenium-dependent hydroxylase accessory protein YqeC
MTEDRPPTEDDAREDPGAHAPPPESDVNEGTGSPPDPAGHDPTDAVDASTPAPDLVEAIDADAGLTPVVGAGGKKTLLYRLAGTLDRVVLTATVRIPVFDDRVASVQTAADPVPALDWADFPLGLVAGQEREDRYEGYDPEDVDRLAVTHDGPVIVKADGARTRWLKAPGDHEPRIPRSADRVVPVASARIVGEPLTESRVHRPERVAAITDAAVGDVVTPEHVATVLTHPEGALKRVPAEADVIALINMVDTPAVRESAETIAHRVLERAPDAVDRVVLTRLISEKPVVDVHD